MSFDPPLPENIDIDSLTEKPWRKPEVDLSDYFNYGFNEDTWRLYCKRQQEIRQEGRNLFAQQAVPNYGPGLGANNGMGGTASMMAQRGAAAAAANSAANNSQQGNMMQGNMGGGGMDWQQQQQQQQHQQGKQRRNARREFCRWRRVR